MHTKRATLRTNDVSFGGWLKQRRNELGLTQEELAERIGCSRIALQKMENGERRPSGQIAHLLAEHLRIPADEIEQFITFARLGQAATTEPGRESEVAERAPWRAAHLA
jgi:transcriptional regulator with XRE-family HTH domain